MASRFSELRELEKEEKRKEAENLRLSKIDTERLLGKDWRNRPQELTARQEKKLSDQRAARKAEVKKAYEDMRSGKTSKLVGEDVSGIPTFKPAELDVKKAEGPVQVRKAIPQQRVFKAMIEGRPEESQVFGTQEEAMAFIKQKGGRGAVASVRGTPEEMARYKEESLSGMREEARLKDLYQQRRSEASQRSEKLQSAMQDYNEAESPELKATAKQRIEEARREIDVAQKTRGMQPEQRKKFETGLADIVQKRKEAEAFTAAKTEKARAQSREQMGVLAQERAIDNQLKFYNQQLGTLRRAYGQARRLGNEQAVFDIGQAIATWQAGVPEDPREQRNVARQGILREKFNQLARERQRREELSKTNPDAAK